MNKIVNKNINNYKFYNCRFFSSSKILNEIRIVKRITQNDLDNFSELTGDTNPIHSTETSEEKRIVHGALLNGLVSGIIGTKLPGPGTIVIAQNFTFPNKCQIEKDIEMFVKLIENRKIIKVKYECRQNDKVVFEGDAKLMRFPVKNE